MIAASAAAAAVILSIPGALFIYLGSLFITKYEAVERVYTRLRGGRARRGLAARIATPRGRRVQGIFIMVLGGLLILLAIDALVVGNS